MVSEPVFITTNDFGPYYRRRGIDEGGQYLIFCYVGQISADAVRPTLTLHPILNPNICFFKKKKSPSL